MSEKQGDREQGRRLGDKLHELREQMKATEGHRIRLKIKALNTTYRVFVGNYHDLVKALNFFGDLENSMALWAEDNRAKLDAYMAEVSRYFHNFLAGAKNIAVSTSSFPSLAVPMVGGGPYLVRQVPRPFGHMTSEEVWMLARGLYMGLMALRAVPVAHFVAHGGWARRTTALASVIHRAHYPNESYSISLQRIS